MPRRHEPRSLQTPHLNSNYGYGFLSALKIPTLLTSDRWLSKYGCDNTPTETSLLLPKSIPPSPPSLADRYGTCTEIIHYGRTSTVRIYALSADSHSPTSRTRTKHLHAVKVFRPSSRPWVVSRHYLEQALSTTVNHPNLLRTLDTLYNSNDELCLVLPYCAAGNLRSLLTLSVDGIPRSSADNYLKQILRAVSYLHGHAIAHRDIRLENILLTEQGVVKVSDFGSAEWAEDGNEHWDPDAETLSADVEGGDGAWKQICRIPPEPKPRDALPYLAPEEFVDCEFDARSTDLWAVGVIYLVLRVGRFLWREARAGEDERFREYVEGRRMVEGYAPIEGLGEERCCNVVYAMLDPNSQRRITASEALRSEWLYGVRVCDAAEMDS